MSTSNRWKKAQDYEQRHWEKLAKRIAARQVDLDWYGWKVDRLKNKFLSRIPHITFEEKKILEIGSGPVGIISFLKGKRRYAIDPLMNFYERDPELIRWRDKDVKYLQGEGESLPFQDGNFSLAILDNVLDHTKSPSTVLKEINRVLEPNGFMYLMVNVHTGLGLTVRFLMEKFQIDKGHPHSYSQKSVRRLLEKIGFEIYYEELEDYREAKQKELSSDQLKNKLKVLLGISDIQYEVLARKG